MWQNMNDPERGVRDKVKGSTQVTNTRWIYDPIFPAVSPALYKHFPRGRAIVLKKLFPVLKCFPIVYRISYTLQPPWLRPPPTYPPPASPSTALPLMPLPQPRRLPCRPLHTLFPLPRMLFPKHTHRAGRFLGFGSQLQRHLFRKGFPVINSQLATARSLYHIARSLISSTALNTFSNDRI